MIRILIADDHPAMRQRIKQLIGEGFPAAYLSEAEDTVSLLSLVSENEWDIIISDLAMPGGGGLFALEKIKQIKPHIPVLIISTYPEDQYADHVIREGAAAFLNKSRANEDLVTITKNILMQSGK